MASGLIRPRVGVDYPGTWAAFVEWFRDDGACREYLVRLRWPDGFVCPHCGSDVGWPTSDERFSCGGCIRRISVTAGTIFHGTRTPLTTWFAAAWYLTNQKHGASALGLQQVLGLGSYQTAWTMLHKYRTAMVRPGRELLSGDIEVDETYVGTESGTAGRHVETKDIVVIAVEKHSPKGLGRIRLRRVDDVSGSSLIGFIRDVTQPGSVILTDGWQGYAELAKSGFVHKRTSLRADNDPAHVVQPGVHRVASLLKRWLLGTLHGGVSSKHLDAYLNEFTFRFNRRTSRQRGMLFYRLIEQAVVTDPAP
ncbi:MAG: IS1595 family transposase [Actinomycetota bacterium]|nr:IS1595 family transposase [Actinomycetota bacterium]